MNAISLYVSASRLLFQSDCDEPNYTDLYRLVPYLRQSLSCTVCANLLVEPYSPRDVCQHHVCRQCIGGRKNLKPTCSSCRNYHTYQPNIQLRILLQCYKGLCEYILGTPVIYTSMHRYVHVDGFSNGTNDTQNLAQLIDEGARFHDEYKSSAGLPKSTISILPCIFTATSQSNHHQSRSSAGPMVKSVANSITTTPTSVQTTSMPVISVHPIVSTKAPASAASSSMASATSAATTTRTMTTTASVLTKRMDQKDVVTLMTNTSMLPNPPIKTVSNGTALYSVMYAGSGNKITIKRKADDTYFNNSKPLSAKEAKEMLDFLSGTGNGSVTTNQLITNSKQQSLQLHSIARPAIIQQSHQIQSQNLVQAMPQIIQTQPPPQKQIQQQHHHHQQQQPQQSQSQNFTKPTYRRIDMTKLLQKRKGCRCGNATPTPGKLTCCGQRCPCYVDSKSCIDCKCRGCRNPHRIDGLKVRPQIPELTSLMQMNTSDGLDMPIDDFASTTQHIKQELMTQNTVHEHNSDANATQHMDLHSETIEYIPNPLDDSNIQVVNVYTTHMPEISSTLPSIIMQDESFTNSGASTNVGNTSILNNRLSMPAEQPPFALLGDDMIKHSFSDDGLSSEDRSDIEIDI